MDKKTLNSSAAAAVSDVNDDTKLKKLTKGDYGTSSHDLKDSGEKKEPVEFLSCRLILHAMIFLGFVVAYILRVTFSEAIVAMVNQTAVGDHTVTSNTSEHTQCPRDPQLQHENGEFVWDRNQQGTVLAAFYYGYVLTQVSLSLGAYILRHKNTGLTRIFLFTEVWSIATI